jgi:hypothetical protein
VAVHDVDVNHRTAASLRGLDFRGQLGEVGREDGWY